MSISKSSSDHHGLGYQHGKDLNSQGVLVKASPPKTSLLVAKIPYLQKDKDVAYFSPVHQSKNNMLTSTCCFCHVKGHRRPSSFKFMKYMKKGYFL